MVWDGFGELVVVDLHGLVVLVALENWVRVRVRGGVDGEGGVGCRVD